MTLKLPDACVTCRVHFQQAFAEEQLGTIFTLEVAVHITEIIVNSDLVFMIGFPGRECFATMTATHSLHLLLCHFFLWFSNGQRLLHYFVAYNHMNIITVNLHIVFRVNIFYVIAAMMTLHVKVELLSHHEILLTLFTVEYFQSEGGMQLPGQMLALLHLVYDRPPDTAKSFATTLAGCRVSIIRLGSVIIMIRFGGWGWGWTHMADHLRFIGKDFPEK